MIIKFKKNVMMTHVDEIKAERERERSGKLLNVIYIYIVRAFTQ